MGDIRYDYASNSRNGTGGPMKRVIDRFVAEEADGRLYTVLCIEETVFENDQNTAGRVTGVTFQTTVGEILTTTDDTNFNVENTNRCLRKVDVTRTPDGILRLRGFAMGVVAIN
jgi:hypothetical protein